VRTAFGRAEKATVLLESKYHRAIRDRAAVHALLKRSSEDLVQRYQTLFENSGTAMVVIENDGTISLANTFFLNLLGYRREDLENRKNVFEIFEPRFRDQEQDYHRRRRTGDVTVPSLYEAQVVSSGEKILDVLIMIGLFPGTRQSVASIIDITDRKQMENDLLRKNEELNRAYGQLAAVEQELRQQFEKLAASQNLLQESEARFHGVFNNANDAIFIHRTHHGAPGRFIEVNDFLCSTVGYSREELLTMDVKDLFSEAQIERAPDIDNVIAERGYDTFYAEFRKKDGSTFPVEVNARIYQFSGQEVVLAVARDITERRRAEQELLRKNEELNLAYAQQAAVEQELRANYENLRFTERKLRESEAWSREFAELLPQFVFEINTEGRLVFVNQYATDVFGITHGMIEAGVNMRDFIIREEWEQVERNLARILEGKKSSYDIYHLMRRDGTLLPANIYTAAVYRDGVLAGFRGIVVDISESLVAQEALQKSETRFRELAELLPQIVFELDDHLKFRFFNWNTIEMTGYAYDDLSQNRIGIYDIIRNSDRPAAARFFAQILQDSTTGHLACGIVTLDGKEIPAIISASPIISENRIAGVRGVIIDIADQKRLEVALAITNKKLNLMNSVTRHDVLNNITGLLGLVDMLEETGSPGEAQALIAEIHNLVIKIKDQIIFTKDYQNVGVKAPQWQSLCQGIRKEASTIGLDGVQLQLPRADAEIYADPFFSRVFYNLIDNSFRHGGTIRNISVETEPVPEGGLLIRYRDDGTGVSSDEKELIFQQGYGKNTGFGLFIIREILEITGLSIRETGTFRSGVLFEILVPKESWRPATGDGCERT
jgi:PAS domain S-box-containing protein